MPNLKKMCNFLCKSAFMALHKVDVSMNQYWCYGVGSNDRFHGVESVRGASQSRRPWDRTIALSEPWVINSLV
jgi:hypothetical protein